MGNTVLGDINHPAPIIMPQQSNPLLAIAATVLATSIPLAGAGAVAGYLLANQNKPTPVEKTQFDDSTVSLGLGRIEDYINK